MTDTTLNSLVTELSRLTLDYATSTGHDAASLAPKLALINLSKKITYSLMDPGMMVQAHSLQMAEMVCVRTLLDLQGFEKMPAEEGTTTTAKELSEASGVQEALLGRPRPLPSAPGDRDGGLVLARQADSKTIQNASSVRSWRRASSRRARTARTDAPDSPRHTPASPASSSR